MHHQAAEVVIVDSSVITFNLDLVMGQNTFNGPHQLWRASSDYSLKVGKLNHASPGY